MKIETNHDVTCWSDGITDDEGDERNTGAAHR